MSKLPDNPLTDQTTPGHPLAAPAPETVLVSSKKVSCDGGGGALGHPKTFYDMGEEDFVECLYCDRRFVFDTSAAQDEH